MSNQCSLVQPSTQTFLPHSAPIPFLIWFPLWCLYSPLSSSATMSPYSLPIFLPFLFSLCHPAPLRALVLAFLCSPDPGFLPQCCLSSSVCPHPSPEMTKHTPLFQPFLPLACLSFPNLMAPHKSCCLFSPLLMSSSTWKQPGNFLCMAYQWQGINTLWSVLYDETVWIKKCIHIHLSLYFVYPHSATPSLPDFVSLSLSLSLTQNMRLSIVSFVHSRGQVGQGAVLCFPFSRARVRNRGY